MAKSIRKIFTTILALCICTCMIVPQALAAEITTETTTEGGITTTVTTTTETEVEGDTTTETETVETDKAGTDENGVDVVYNEVVESETVTTEDETGTTVTESSVTDGSETKTWTEDVEVGDANQPEVEVELIPGEETSNTVTDTETVVEGDVPEDESDTEYDYTESEVIINKEVTAEASEIETEVVESEADLTPLAPEDYDGKYYDYDEGLIGGLNATSLKSYADAVAQPDADGYDFQFTGYGEGTNAARAQSGYVVYLRDDDGNVMLDADGNPIIESITFTDKYQDGMGSTPSIFALTTYDDEGEIETHYYAYCIDNDTGAIPGAWYRISNLEDSDYYPTPESSDYLRAVAMNGYWGQKEGMGSADLMSEKILAYYGADTKITVEDANGKPVTYTVAEVLEIMTEADALTMTQAAIWSYSNGAIATRDGEDGNSVLGVYSVDKPNPKLANVDRDYNSKRDALLKIGYEWLISLPGMPAPESSTVINEKHFITDASLIVGDKVGEDEVTNDGIYETSVSFALGFTPGESDELYMELKYTDIDAKEVVVTKRLAPKGAEDTDDDTITADDNGKYTIGGLKLSENKDFRFDFSLTGKQVLNKGVYIYQSYVDDNTAESQTMVGIASGTQDVTVNATMTGSFSVDENKNVTEEHYWHSETDPEVEFTPAPPVDDPEVPEDNDDNPVVPDDGTVVPDDNAPVVPPQQPTAPVAPPQQPAAPTAPVYIPDDAVPQGVMELDGEVIIDEEVPLADVPATGDNSELWLILSAAVIIGLVLVNLSNKKRTEA